MENSAEKLSLEERVARLEGKLGWKALEVELKFKYFLIALLLLVLALVAGIGSLGLPNHYYQFIFACLSLTVFYHKDLLVFPKRIYEWLLTGLNVFVLSILFKLVIGSGRAQPLMWLKLPTTVVPDTEENKKWYELMPDLSVEWQQTGLSEMVFDLTIIQTFLFILTLVGAIFNFQPFASLTAILLLVFSLPALISFDWTLVFPTIIIAAIAFYLQSVDLNSEKS